mmetsp:Transcript_30780/g.100190  ORF Transcript_30780/g.100190 Transcript_30780/m.100190 type:complete len:217 (-) Transcript_30780:764-1414(-)
MCKRGRWPRSAPSPRKTLRAAFRRGWSPLTRSNRFGARRSPSISGPSSRTSTTQPRRTRLPLTSRSPPPSSPALAPAPAKRSSRAPISKTCTGRPTKWWRITPSPDADSEPGISSALAPSAALSRSRRGACSSWRSAGRSRSTSTWRCQGPRRPSSASPSTTVTRSASPAPPAQGSALGSASELCSPRSSLSLREQNIYMSHQLPFSNKCTRADKS